MGLAILAEALARIEHKLDYLLRHHSVPVMPMYFTGNSCPVCNKLIEYQVDVKHQVVVRRCDCTTGKIPSAIPLTPVPQAGVTNGNASSDAAASDDRAEEGPRRKAR